MNDELYKSFLGGDSTAQTAVRNHMRAIAARVLASPQWQFPDDNMRREMEQQAARETVDSPAPTMLGGATAVMGTAVRLGLQHLRKVESMKVEDHPGAQIIAGAALETLSSTAKQDLDEHLEECASCRRHLAAASNALRSAVTAQKLVPKPQKTVQESPPSSRARPKPSPRPRPAPTAGAKKDYSHLGVLLPLVVIGAVLGAHWYSQRPNARESIESEMALLLPAELPPASRANELNTVGEEAVKAMSQGRCSYTARRLKVSLDQDPDDLLALYYLGLAHVCLRNGSEALEALSEVASDEEYPPFGLSWWLAQAQLLDGSIDEGLTTLDALGKENHPRAPYARSLAARIRAQL